MDILERVWEVLSGIVNAILGRFERLITSIFGSANARYLKRLQPRVDAINALEPKYEAMSHDELREQTTLFRQRLAKGETLDDILVEAFAVCREAGKRFRSMRHYDVQLLGGMILHDGSIAEMVTGEGKTLVATLAAYLNALGGSVHVITVNDYLARRDMEWMGPLFTNLGLTVGAIYSGMDAAERQHAYDCDITYGTNNEFGFDYLRDNMRMAAKGDDRFPKHMQQSQGPLTFAIIDEVDNILIDEARTPLIISGPAEDDITKYQRADKVARGLKKEVHFEVKEKEHNVSLTDEGVREAEKLAGVESFYTAGNMQWPHLIDNSLKAHFLYKRDVNYVINDGKIVIVDEFTGRLMEGRQWSDGLHQAVEAKEGVQIKQENQTLATVTLQNFFKLYDKLGGMTGTALTEAGEFWKIYKLDVIGVPTNRPMQRIESPDVIYRSEREKYVAIADEIERLNKFTTVETTGGDWHIGKLVRETESEVEVELSDATKRREVIPMNKVKHIQKPGRPILVGTVSIEKSEALGALLNGRGVKHEVLNAKQHKREAEIVAQAGRLGAVTIATNMAGRGTDIVMGGNPETMAWAELQNTYASRLDVPNEVWEERVDHYEKQYQMKAEGELAKGLGGLCVIGTERHEARRIDLQLRGRCGRQGDPGSSRFYLSLEDDLMRIFAGEWVRSILTRLGMQEGEAIESKMVSRRIEGAQKKVEERNFEIRKNLLEYDEVMDEQRKRVYNYRQAILDGVNCRDLMLEMIREQIDDRLGTILSPTYGVETFSAAAGSLLGAELDPRDYRNTPYEEAEKIAHDEAERMAESNVQDAIDENLPQDAEDEWNWSALATWANTRYGTNYRDRDLKKVGRDMLDERLVDDARKWVAAVDLSDTARFLDKDFGVNTARGWLWDKFAIQLTEEEVADKEAHQITELAHAKAEEAYDSREAEYAIMAAFNRFRAGAGAGGQRGALDREGLVEWANRRFNVELSLDDIKNKQGEEIAKLLIAHSADANKKAQEVFTEAMSKLDTLFAGSQNAHADTLGAVSGMNGKLDDLANWLKTNTGAELSTEELADLDQEAARRRVSQAVEDRFRPEMRRMERGLLLQLLDSAWKEHLLAMDHLRSSVGLRGYAQVDPKVEYKREGMRMFEQMWDSLGAYVTDLVFKMETLDTGFVQSTWVEHAQERHDAGPSATDIAKQQEAGIDASNQGEKKPEPIRNREEKVGRNEPCPCGSGKKYKQCCGRAGGAG
ncbi:preprotein translocase subunit SecA [Posidoniimonas polymericola]|uniref:Protein translocase subunit SecA n=1 Tax=Posidoniimonas polymericola TaxID=2528002 RepID=A0A5C5YRI3_9BACT|nr:preprotein translocase subunit SecA [Posidoniimonas polymericola]TWT77330.1 preprotein translocase subunit SecA [Posidoniimonas polymericola]